MTDPSLAVAPTYWTTALAHVRLPTRNCMTDRVGDGMRLHGRCPTYVRPSGGEPIHTGRVCELSVTLRPGRQLPGGWTATTGELTLGDGHTAALGGGASALRTGG